MNFKSFVFTLIVSPIPSSLVADSFAYLPFVEPTEVQREAFLSICSPRIPVDVAIETAEMDFHKIARVETSCISEGGVRYCPSFVYSDMLNSCRIVFYSSGNGLSASFRENSDLRGSNLALDLFDSDDFDDMDLAVSPYEFSSPNGTIIIQDTPDFVEIINGH